MFAEEVPLRVTFVTVKLE